MALPIGSNELHHTPSSRVGSEIPGHWKMISYYNERSDPGNSWLGIGQGSPSFISTERPINFKH